MTKTYPYVGTFVVTSDFGYRNISYGSTYHKGIDLGSTDGNMTIVSATPGTVQRASADANSGYGNHVYVTNQDGTGCLYAHLSSIAVSVGQQVSCGTKIGMQGGSGSSGPNTYASHLHFGVSKSGTYEGAHADSSNWVNPAIWFGMASSGKAKGMSFTGGGTVLGGTTETSTTTSSSSSTGSIISNGSVSLVPSGEYYEVTDIVGVYSDWLYGRRYRVFVQLDGSDALDVSEMRCTFSLNKVGFGTPPFNEIKIYNLSPETENKIIKQGQKIIVEAGYEGDQYGVIFAGSIVQPIRSKENGVDYVLQLICMDAQYYSTYGLVGTTLVAQQTSRKAIDEITSKANYDIQQGDIMDTSIVYPRGKVLFGSPTDLLEQMTRTEDAAYYFDGDKINIVTAVKYKEGTIPSFGPDSGLLGTPEQTAEGISCKLLLNPRVQVNSLFHIDNTKVSGYQYTQGSVVRQLDSEGIYRVISLTHVGDTRGDDWYTEVQAVGQAGTLPSIVANSTIFAY